MGSEVEVISCKKLVLDAAFLWQITSHKSQMAFMGLDFEANKPRMNAELRVMMAKL